VIVAFTVLAASLFFFTVVATSLAIRSLFSCYFNHDPPRVIASRSDLQNVCLFSLLILCHSMSALSLRRDASGPHSAGARGIPCGDHLPFRTFDHWDVP